MSFFDWRNNGPKLDLADLKKSEKNKARSVENVKKKRAQGIDPGQILGISKKSDLRIRNYGKYL